jgi:hypothetical protein
LNTLRHRGGRCELGTYQIERNRSLADDVLTVVEVARSGRERQLAGDLVGRLAEARDLLKIVLDEALSRILERLDDVARRRIHQHVGIVHIVAAIRVERAQGPIDPAGLLGAHAQLARFRIHVLLRIQDARHEAVDVIVEGGLLSR